MEIFDDGLDGILLVFDPSFANPLLHAGERNVKMGGNIKFVDIICTDIFLDILKKLMFNAVWTQILLIILRKFSSAEFTGFYLVK